MLNLNVLPFIIPPESTVKTISKKALIKLLDELEENDPDAKKAG